MSGHNRWSKIKHTKAAADAKKSKGWTKLIKEITVSARLKTSICHAVMNAIGTAASAVSSSGTVARGTGTRFARGTTTRSAQPPQHCSPSSMLRGQKLSRPERQAWQCPHERFGFTRTRSPIATPVTPSPIADT